jgi:hypothetical protein
MEYGGLSASLRWSTGIWCCSQKRMSASREVRSHSRQGAMTRIEGSRA